MDIKSGKPYPAGSLSNFARRTFTFRKIECHSMEGLLQGLKFASADMQREICKKAGFVAKKAGAGKPWYRNQRLWWQGEPIMRFSQEYQDLLDEAFHALFHQNQGAQKALLASRDATLTHSIGKTKTSETVLTRREFCSRLTKIRRDLQVSDLIG